MEEQLKDKLILILSILTAIFFISTIGSCNNSYRLKSARDKEMGTRLDLEEKMTKATQERGVSEAKMQEKNKELEEGKAALDTVKKSLLQEQLVNQSLKEELEKVTKLKETLEENLKEALVTDKSIKK